MATYADAVAAVKQAIRNEWTATTVVFENENPPELVAGDGQPVPFLMVEFQSDSATQRSIGSPGSNWFEDAGAVVGTFFVPAGTGSDAATGHAAALADQWRNREISLGTGACVRTWAPQVGRGTPATSENPEGRWWAVAVSIPMEFLRAA